MPTRTIIMLGFLILALIGVFWLQAKLKSIKPAETSSLSEGHESSGKQLHPTDPEQGLGQGTKTATNSSLDGLVTHMSREVCKREREVLENALEQGEIKSHVQQILHATSNTKCSEFRFSQYQALGALKTVTSDTYKAVLSQINDFLGLAPGLTHLQFYQASLKALPDLSAADAALVRERIYTLLTSEISYATRPVELLMVTNFLLDNQKEVLSHDIVDLVAGMRKQLNDQLFGLVDKHREQIKQYPASLGNSLEESATILGPEGVKIMLVHTQEEFELAEAFRKRLLGVMEQYFKR